MPDLRDIFVIFFSLACIVPAQKYATEPGDRNERQFQLTRERLEIFLEQG